MKGLDFNVEGSYQKIKENKELNSAELPVVCMTVNAKSFEAFLGRKPETMNELQAFRFAMEQRLKNTLRNCWKEILKDAKKTSKANFY